MSKDVGLAGSVDQRGCPGVGVPPGQLLTLSRRRAESRFYCDISPFPKLY